MNELSESELRVLEEMEPHEFHRVLMEIVAGGMTAWKHESARPRTGIDRQDSQHSPPLPAAVGLEDLEAAEVLV